ncbi:hypothetical protein K4K61_000375 [Colletotrichum sp. SAR11_59]|nr:hypothetical protein K4K61_000375 [Colletotrichum sp. SAR11_59]
MSSNTTENTLHSWVASPDGRGSLDILWACLATTFLSTWSAIFLNVPDPSDSAWTYFRRKAFITIVTLLGPEYLLMFAMGEWQSAQASVARFKALRGDDLWTLRHGFFANMGGFALKTSDDTCFFLDAAQIAWLLEREAISRARFDERFLLDAQAIEDRNKSDLFIRVVAVAQALWFCVNMVARAAQGLAVSTLEITTVGIIIDSVLVYWVWREKPADVQWVEYVHVDMTLNELVALEPGQAARELGYITPLDFASREIWSATLIYNYMRNLLKNLPGATWVRSPETEETERKSMGRRSDNDSPPITGVEGLFILVAGMAFFGVNFIPWNFHFPTDVEMWMWRGSSIGLTCVGLGTGIHWKLCRQRTILVLQTGAASHEQ